MDGKILFVDDDVNILSAFKRQLRTLYDIDTAQGGTAGLEKLRTESPFAVVVADLRMPGMDGVQFLSKAKEISPDSVRMMLTGHADLGAAINAINEGSIFRLLTKPCAHEALITSLNDALKQYRLVTAERDLLEKTLGNTVKLLIEVLSLTNPMAFSRTLRLRRIVRQVTIQLKTKDSWQHELAAMLSQTGCVTLSSEILEKIYAGVPLSKNEQSLFASHPMIGYKLLVNIPRLEIVASIIKDQQKHFEEYPTQFESGEARKIAQGAQILKVALDYDQLIHNDVPHSEAVKLLKGKPRQYNPEIVNALGDKEIITGGWLFKMVDSESAEIGMIVDEDIYAKDGDLVMAKGQEMSMASVERLQQLAKGIGVVEPFRVLIPWQSAKQKVDESEEKNRSTNVQ
jgi:response regulator RpfG family c-di-GMP phosphodiesterase